MEGGYGGFSGKVTYDTEAFRLEDLEVVEVSW